MEPKEILKKAARGGISTSDIKRARSLRVVGFDQDLQSGFLGFLDGVVIKVSPDKYRLMIDVASIMNPDTVIYDVKKKFGPDNSVLKMMMVINESTGNQ